MVASKVSWLGQADMALTSWILSWGAHQLLHDPLRLFHANIFYPLPNSLAFSEHLLAGVLLILPLDILHHNAVLDNNVLIAISFVLGGTGTALLIMDLGASAPAAIVGGILFAFSPLRLAQLGRVHDLSTHWMPFALLFLRRLLRTGQWRPGVAFAVCLLLESLSSVYYLYYFGIMVVLFVASYAACGCPTAPRAYWRALALGTLVLLALVPTLVPYADVRERFAPVRDPQQAIAFSAVVMQYLGAILAPQTALTRDAVDGRLLTPLFGSGLVLLAALGMWRGAAAEAGGRRIAGLYLILAIGMALLSLGPVMRMRLEPVHGLTGPHSLLAAIVPGFNSLRVPERAAAGALLALSVLAGLGGETLLGHPRRPTIRWAAGAVVAGIALLECWPPGCRLLQAPWTTEVPAVYRWLATQPGDFAIVELPLGPGLQEAVYTMLSAYHWKRLVNGYSGILPARDHLTQTLASFPDAASLRLLRDLNVHSVILHTAMLRPRRADSCAQIASRVQPHLALRYADEEACVLDVLSAPSPTARPIDRLVALGGAHLTSSSGDDPAAAADGDRNTHWVQTVSPTRQGWLQVDLPEAKPLTRLVIHVGRHFGEHLRAYAVATSDDTGQLAIVAHQPVAAAPLRAFLTDPDDVTIEIALPGTPVRHLRLIRTAARATDVVLFLDWGWWGVHELDLYESVNTP